MKIITEKGKVRVAESAFSSMVSRDRLNEWESIGERIQLIHEWDSNRNDWMQYLQEKNIAKKFVVGCGY